MPRKRHTPATDRDRVLALASKRRLIRARDLDAICVSREVLRRLVAGGDLNRLGRGLYAAAGMLLSEHEMLAAAAVRVPHAVGCLLSALRFHGLTTQNPSEIWLAVDRKEWLPSVSDLPLHIVRFSGAALTAGIETHIVDGVPISIYSAAKTVADCFKYRGKIGVDVATEALYDYWRSRNRSIDELWKYAAVCRVSAIMRPYLEAVASQGA